MSPWRKFHSILNAHKGRMNLFPHPLLSLFIIFCHTNNFDADFRYSWGDNWRSFKFNSKVGFDLVPSSLVGPWSYPLSAIISSANDIISTPIQSKCCQFISRSLLYDLNTRGDTIEHTFWTSYPQRQRYLLIDLLNTQPKEILAIPNLKPQCHLFFYIA